jgi:hypothetical protein
MRGELVALGDGAVTPHDDPHAFVELALLEARDRLRAVQSLDDARDVKAFAETIATIAREKHLAEEAQLSATEIVRRCERRTGELVRRGQRDGTILSRGQTLSKLDPVRAQDLLQPHEAVGVSRKDSAAIGAIYRFADVPEPVFNEAVADAKFEGNLSRANVTRKINQLTQDEESPVPEPEQLTGRNLTRAKAWRRETEQRVLSAQGCGIYLVNQRARVPQIVRLLSDQERREWSTRLKETARNINEFRRELEGKC